MGVGGHEQQEIALANNSQRSFPANLILLFMKGEGRFPNITVHRLRCRCFGIFDGRTDHGQRPSFDFAVQACQSHEGSVQVWTTPPEGNRC